MDSASPLACSLIRAHSKRGVCIRVKEGNGGGNRRKRACATIFILLGFITTVSLTANTHCMTDGWALACLAP